MINKLNNVYVEDGRLLLQGQNGVYDLADEAHIRFLLPLLECNKTDFEDYIIKSEADINIVNQILETLIKYPFKHKMEYWCDKALDWIDVEALQQNLWLYTIDDNWMPQPLKHKILRLRKQFRL